MGCCGKRRSEWAAQKAAAPVPNENREPAPDNSPKIFEYTGEGSIRIRGHITRQTYYFRFPGHRLEVAREDAFALMAQSLLKVVG